MPSNNVWASTTPASEFEHRVLPSGQECDARKIGVEELVMAGVVTETDSLAGLVDQKYIRKVRGGKGPDTETIDTTGLMRDGKALGSLVSMIDRCLPLIVVDPQVLCHTDKDGTPIPKADRKAGMVYTDQINVMDKMELFTWSVGDAVEMEPFRGTAAGDVAGVGNGKKVRKPAQRTPRSKSR